MVAAPSVAVAAIDHPDAETFYIHIRLLFYESCKLTRGPVRFAADTFPAAGLGLGLAKRDALAEDTHLIAVRHVLAGGRSTDDVIGEHRVYIHLGLLGLICVIGRPGQALLFAGNGHKNY